MVKRLERAEIAKLAILHRFPGLLRRRDSAYNLAFTGLSITENRILRDQIKGRLLLSEAEKVTLAEIAHRLGRKALEDVAATAKAMYGDHFEPRTTLLALSYFADGDLPRLPALMQNALRSAAAGVKLDELPMLVGKRDLASQGKER